MTIIDKLHWLLSGWRGGGKEKYYLDTKYFHGGFANLCDLPFGENFGNTKVILKKKQLITNIIDKLGSKSRKKLLVGLYLWFFLSKSYIFGHSGSTDGHNEKLLEQKKSMSAKNRTEVGSEFVDLSTKKRIHNSPKTLKFIDLHPSFPFCLWFLSIFLPHMTFCKQNSVSTLDVVSHTVGQRWIMAYV